MEPFERLEKEFAEWAGVENVVACSSGTAALHLALESLRLPPGSEVIVPDLCMVAAARAVTLANLTPVFVDCGDDLLMDAELAESAVTEKTAAILAVHVYGRRSNMDAFDRIALCSGDRVKLIEDLAEAHGVEPHLGTDAACWSFYRNKIIAGEEGGCIAFRDPAHAALARQLRNLGFTGAHDFNHVPRGHNYRLANCLAEKILKNLAVVDKPCVLRDGTEVRGGLLEARRRIEGWYDAHCPPAWRMPTRDVCWVFDIRIPGLTSEVQDRIIQTLNREGVAARHAFKPLSVQEEYLPCRFVTRSSQGREDSESDRAAREVVYLPVVPGVTAEADAARAFAIIRACRS